MVKKDKRQNYSVLGYSNKLTGIILKLEIPYDVKKALSIESFISNFNKFHYLEH